LTACAAQAEEIIAEGDRQGRIVMVGHTFVYNPAVVAMKEIIASGQLGEIYYINATRVNLVCSSLISTWPGSGTS